MGAFSRSHAYDAGYMTKFLGKQTPYGKAQEYMQGEFNKWMRVSKNWSIEMFIYY